MLILALATFAVALLPVLTASTVSRIAGSLQRRGVRVPRVMREGPWREPRALAVEASLPDGRADA